MSSTGEPIGHHNGLSQYTIGQRRGLGISGPTPSYVQQMNREHNTVTVATREKMYSSNCCVSQINWLIPPKHWPPGEIYTHIRYNHQGVKSKIKFINDKNANIKFNLPQFAVTPGQSAVFYSNDILLGGGIITKPSKSMEQNGLDNH